MNNNRDWGMSDDNEPIRERRTYTHMDDIKGKLDRIEHTTNSVHTSQKIIENSFINHEQQNDRDFKTVSEELNRNESGWKEKYYELAADHKVFKKELDDIKVQIARWGGALTLLIPIVTWAANHLFVK